MASPRLRAVAFLGALLAACSGAATPARDTADVARARALLREARSDLHRARLEHDAAAGQIASIKIAEARALSPDDFAARELECVALASRHRFSEALESARETLRRAPSSAIGHGILVDALVELGKYEEAVAAAQEMVDLRPSPASLGRAAYLRSLHGEREGAIELMEASIDATGDPAERAWGFSQLALEQLAGGLVSDARRSCERALAHLPNYRPAELALARIQAGSGDAAGAEVVLRAILARSDDADAHAALAELLDATGRREEARAQFDAAERLERAELAAGGGSEPHHLVDVLLARGDRVDEALSLARSEASRRRDVFTCGRLALALAAAGRGEEAARAASDALRTGSDDPSLLAEAGEAAAAAGDARTAVDRLRRALARRAALSPITARKAEERLAKLERA